MNISWSTLIIRVLESIRYQVFHQLNKQEWFEKSMSIISSHFLKKLLPICTLPVFWKLVHCGVLCSASEMLPESPSKTRVIYLDVNFCMSLALRRAPNLAWLTANSNPNYPGLSFHHCCPFMILTTVSKASVSKVFVVIVLFWFFPQRISLLCWA